MGLLNWFNKEPTKPSTPAPQGKSVMGISINKATAALPKIVGDYADGGGQLATTQEEGSYATSDLIYACVDYIASTASQAGLQIHEKDAEGKLTPIKDKKIVRLFGYAPNDFYTWGDFIDLAVKSYLLSGNTYMTYEKNGSNLEMWCLTPPSKVTVVPDRKNYVTGYMYNDEVAYKVDEVCHWKNNTVSNEFYGQSAIKPLLDALILEGYGTEDLKSFYENSSVGEGVLTSEFPLTVEQIDQLRDQFKGLYGQEGSRHSAMIMPNGMTYSNITMSPKDSMLLESLEISEHRVLQSFHLNPLVVGGKLSTYTTNSRELQQMVFNGAVRPILYSMADNLTLFFKKLLKNDSIVVTFDFDRIPELADSMSDKAGNAKTLWSTGLATLNEARDMVGLPKVDHENANKNMIASYLFGDGIAIEDLGKPTNEPAGNSQTTGSTDADGGTPDNVSTET